MQDVALVKRLVAAVATEGPVTAKIRLLPSRRASLDLALAIQESGAQALCVHGRTVHQHLGLSASCFVALGAPNMPRSMG